MAPLKTGLEGKPWWHGAVAGTAVIVVFFGVLYWLKFGPMREEIERLQADLAGKQQQILEGQAAQQQLPAFRKEVQDLELELDKLLRILPARRKSADLLRRIRSLAEQGDLTLKRFTPGQLSDRDFYSEWPIEIEVEGGYHSLALFFDKIGRYSRIVNVENLNIESTANAKGPNTIRSSFIAKTFVYKTPEPPAEGEEAGGPAAVAAGAGGAPPPQPSDGSPLTSRPPGGDS